MPERRRLRLHLRTRVLVLTSLAVVLALLVLGVSLITVLSHSLYGQQLTQSLGVVRQTTAQIDRSLSLSSSGAGRPTSPGAPLTGPANTTPGSGTTVTDPLVAAGALVQSSEAATGFDFLLVGPSSAPSSDPRLTPAGVPAPLVRSVASGHESYTYIRSPVERSDALLVGTPISGGVEGACPPQTCQAYFYFPLASQQHTISLVTRILVSVGAILLVAVVSFAAIAIGRVLEPVRTASDVAERVAAGDLTARIAGATSKDDFGRLAESFNRMTDTLSQKIAELEQLSRLQARFVSDVSHELRTPLATVRVAADVLHASRAALDPDAQRAAVLLQRELERFENLLEDLLEISRFDAGVIVLDPVEVDVARLAAEVVDILEPIALGRGVELRLEPDPASGPAVAAADPRRLERVFTNLVKNAIEHTPGGTVRVQVSRTRTTVVVRVVDDGEGIPAEELPQIFERFYRVDQQRSRAQAGTGTGTGLGLAIALENVRLHGGSIEVSSRVGEGSEFVVRLPAVPTRPEPAREPPAPGAPAPGTAPPGIESPARPQATVGG